jgi:hypothetical protein
MGAPAGQHPQAVRPAGDSEMSHAIIRLEQQVAFNYSMLQSHEQAIQRIGDNVLRVQHEIGQIVVVIDDFRKDVVTGRLPVNKPLDPSRYDPADVEVLANQIANIANKANEIDNLKVSIDLLKQRFKRIESTPATPGQQPAGIIGRPEQHHYEAARAQQLQQAQSHPQPPNRPGAALSAEHTRQPAHPSGPPVLESQTSSGFHAAHERQPNASEQAQQAARQSGFRAAEPLPPPAAITNWRPAEGFPPSGPPPPQPHSHPLRSHPNEAEPPASGWAAVNLGQAAKRSLDEHHPQHDSSQPGSPKRQKLAPLKPRSSFGDDHHQSPYAQPAHIEAAHQARGRIPSGDIPLQPHPPANSAPAPGPTAGNSYRFITSTGQPDVQEHWRAGEGDPAGGRFEHTTTGTGRGRGRGSRGGRRGGRGRGGRSSSGAAEASPMGPDAPLPEHAHVAQIPPEYREQPQWTATQQPHSNGHYPGQHAYSPPDPSRPHPQDLAVHTGGPQHHGLPYPAGHEHEFPATPIASNADPYAMGGDLDSANRKTRTKPIRNSDGVLIRKDGRPDMRSVSSANNLRKVHAKKEAEKAEMEGRTPTSGRSLAPANSSSLSDEDEGDYMEMDGETDRGRSEGRNGASQEAETSESLLRHRELMSRMFQESSARSSKGTAEAWFPRVEGPPPDVKREDQENKEREARWRGMEDTTMRDSEPAVSEREVSQRPSEPVVASREQTCEQTREQASVEATPNVAVASGPAASEQPESEIEASAAPSAPESAALSVAGDKDVAAGKKDSTQLESRVPSESVAPPPSEPAAAATPAAVTAE